MVSIQVRADSTLVSGTCVSVSVTFLNSVTKTPNKSHSHVRMEGIFGHSLRVQSITVGRPRWHKYKVAGHIAITARKQREVMAGAKLQSRTPAHSMLPKV